MNTSTLEVHLAQAPTITMPQDNALGVTVSATVGVSLLMVGYLSVVKEPGKRRLALGKRMDEWVADRLDWKSVLYWCIGLLGATAILGSSSGVTTEYLSWIQDNVIGTDLLDFLGDLLKLILCISLVYAAAKKREGEKATKGDIIWGTACAVALPVLSDFGAIGSCIIVTFMAMKSRNDSRADLYWGVSCALLFPLGGTATAWVTAQAAHFIGWSVSLGIA